MGDSHATQGTRTKSRSVKQPFNTVLQGRRKGSGTRTVIIPSWNTSPCHHNRNGASGSPGLKGNRKRERGREDVDCKGKSATSQEPEAKGSRHVPFGGENTDQSSTMPAHCTAMMPVQGRASSFSVAPMCSPRRSQRRGGWEKGPRLCARGGRAQARKEGGINYENEQIGNTYCWRVPPVDRAAW